MSDLAFARAGSPPFRPRAFDSILFGGLTAGVLDILYAFIYYGYRNGAPPMAILHSVAAGLLGREAARAGGVKTALLGLFLHFLNAFIIATVFYLASLLLPTLIRQPLIWGPLYGVLVFFVMNYVVIPLSAIGPRATAIPLAAILNGTIAHAILIGLPIALFAQRSARRAAK